MGKQKYRFNPETLTLETKSKQFKKRLFQFALFLTASLVMGSALSVFFILNYQPPKAKALQAENDQLLIQYQQLNSKLNTVENAIKNMQTRDDNIYRVILNSEPIPSSVRKVGTGGSDRYTKLNQLTNHEIVATTAKRIDQLSKQAFIQSESYKEVLELAVLKEKELECTPTIRPISDNDLVYTSSGWGTRMHPIYKVPKFHWGVDIVAPTGTPIYAPGNGTVKKVRSSRTGHGKHVVIDHGFGYETLFGHMSKFNVTSGQKVKRGDIIGYVGNTGTSTAPHLHYEVHKNGQKVNPINYYFKDLSSDEYQQIIARTNDVKISFD